MPAVIILAEYNLPEEDTHHYRVQIMEQILWHHCVTTLAQTASAIAIHTALKTAWLDTKHDEPDAG